MNALVWGAIATWHVCLIAGIFLGLLARISFPGLIVKISAMQLAPYLVIGAILALLISHMGSRFAQKALPFDYLKYDGVPIELQRGWEACNVRNGMGYSALGIGSPILAIAIVAARVGLFIL